MDGSETTAGMTGHGGTMGKLIYWVMNFSFTILVVFSMTH